jgi:hypothetical protein
VIDQVARPATHEGHPALERQVSMKFLPHWFLRSTYRNGQRLLSRLAAVALVASALPAAPAALAPGGGQPPTIEGATTIEFDMPVNSPGYVSGDVNDPDDPARDYGMLFIVADPDTPLANLIMLAPLSSDDTVVPQANLVVDPIDDVTGEVRLYIEAAGHGDADITLTVRDPELNEASYAIHYAASNSSVTPKTRFHTETSDASAAIALDGTFMLVATNENEVIRKYYREYSGRPVDEEDVRASLGTSGGSEVDLEASTRLGDSVFWMGSHGNNNDGDRRTNRERIFRTDLTGGDLPLTVVGYYADLRNDLIAWDNANAQTYGLEASAAEGPGQGPEKCDGSGFNIEALSMGPDSTTAYIGFRAPLVPTSGRTKALVIPVTNMTDLVDGSVPAGGALFGAALEWDLGMRGVRSMERNADGDYLIIAGPPDDPGGCPGSVFADDFELYTWSGDTNEQPQPLANNLSALNTQGSFEGIVEVPAPLNLDGSTDVQLVTDNGSTDWYGDGQRSKDLLNLEWQKFRTDWVALQDGAPPPPAITVQFTSASQNVPENAGTAMVDVGLSGAAAGTVTVDYATADGTAAAGSDYGANANTLSFAPGDTVETISIPITNDADDEPDESFSLSLSNPSGASLGAQASTTVTIVDDDPPVVPPGPTNKIYLPMVVRGTGGAAAGSGELVPAGATWKYLDTGADLGTAWRSNAFDDSAWASGPAQLGYGDGDEATTVNGGPVGNRSITTYFRHAFTVSSPAAYKMLDLRLLRDDGAVVYLNGQEVVRNNMPGGTITAGTTASVAVGGADESLWYQYAISSTQLVAGTNVLAVEVHQAGPTSSDISFDLSLTGTPASAVRFAAIGDYGTGDANTEGRVANLVKSWNPDFIITLGDNNYPVGAQATIQANIGAFYGDYITADLATNRFWPSLGNHDWYTDLALPYLNYFTLPGNERYYDLVKGPVHLFAIDSEAVNPNAPLQGEPDGVTAGSVQGQDMLARIDNSTACWQIAYFHHAPYSSANHGSNTNLQWPFKDGQGEDADAVLAGHDHSYERVIVDGLAYFVNGLGGASQYTFGTPVNGSVIRYRDKHGAMLLTATETMLTFTFVTVDGEVIDTYAIGGGCN